MLLIPLLWYFRLLLLHPTLVAFFSFFLEPHMYHQRLPAVVNSPCTLHPRTGSLGRRGTRLLLVHDLSRCSGDTHCVCSPLLLCVHVHVHVQHALALTL